MKLETDAYVVVHDPEEYTVNIQRLRFDRCAVLPDDSLYYIGNGNEKPRIFRSWHDNLKDAQYSAHALARDMFSGVKRAAERLEKYSMDMQSIPVI